MRPLTVSGFRCGIALVCVLAFSITGAPCARASFASRTADDLLGQYAADGRPDFSKSMGYIGPNNGKNGSPNANDVGFGNVDVRNSTWATPEVDPVNHRLYVVDSSNSRIVFYDLNNSNVLTDYVQDGVIGQPDLFQSGYNRQNGSAADTSAAQANSLSGPSAVAVTPPGGIWVADSINNRVLFFPEPAGDGSDVATEVIGQPDLVSNQVNRGGTTNRNALRNPTDVALAPGGLWVVDRGNNRLLFFRSPVGDGSDAAAKVIGQPNFTANHTGRTARRVSSPTGMLATGSRIWVADTANHRVLRFTNPVGDGTDGADLVLGQASATSATRPSPAQNAVTSPTRLAYDSSTNRIYVAEYDGHRVTGWPIPGSGSGASARADVLLGQAAYTADAEGSNNGGVIPTQTRMAYVSGVTMSGNRLYVFDGGNARVLRFTRPASNPVSDQVIGHVVAGSPSFAGSLPNNSGNRAGLFRSMGMAIDRVRHKLYISELFSNRIVIYDLDGDNQLADHAIDGVIGQASLDGGVANRTGAPSARSLLTPYNIALDAGGNLWVADAGNNRVLRFPRPVGDGSDAADKVLGQPDFTSNAINRGGRPAANTLSGPWGLSIDTAGRIWVADTNNHRVLRFTSPVGDGTDVADGVVGQAGFTRGAANRGGEVAADTLSAPRYALFHNGALWVADTGNSRVVGYSPVRGDGTDAAAKVLGQPDLTTGEGNRGGLVAANTLSDPTSLMFLSNDLWIADHVNSRLVRYRSLVGDGTDAADRQIGQANFTDRGQNRATNRPGANTLALPNFMLVAGNHFFVSDQANFRVLIYDM
jgi:hypothetical protein